MYMEFVNLLCIGSSVQVKVTRQLCSTFSRLSEDAAALVQMSGPEEAAQAIKLLSGKVPDMHHSHIAYIWQYLIC